MIGRLFRRRLMPVLLAAVLLLGAGVYALTGTGRGAARGPPHPVVSSRRKAVGAL